MEKFIPYEKLSKKEKRKLDRSRRSSWGELNPVTRKPANSRAYNRSKARNRSRYCGEPIPGYLFASNGILRKTAANVVNINALSTQHRLPHFLFHDMLGEERKWHP